MAHACWQLCVLTAHGPAHPVTSPMSQCGQTPHTQVISCWLSLATSTVVPVSPATRSTNHRDYVLGGVVSRVGLTASRAVCCVLGAPSAHRDLGSLTTSVHEGNTNTGRARWICWSRRGGIHGGVTAGEDGVLSVCGARLSEDDACEYTWGSPVTFYCRFSQGYILLLRCLDAATTDQMQGVGISLSSNF